MLKPKFDNLEVRFYGSPTDREYFDTWCAKVADFEWQLRHPLRGPQRTVESVQRR